MSYYQDLGFDWGSAVKKIGGGALDIVQTQARTAGEAAAYKELALAQAAKEQRQAGTPKWLLPVGIGAVALVAILVLKK
jgi:hypothetical protein